MDYSPDRYGPPIPPPKQQRDGDKGGGQVLAKVTKRVMATVTRVASNDDGNDNDGKSNGDGIMGGRQARTRAMAVGTTVAGNNEGNGDGNEGGKQQRV